MSNEDDLRHTISGTQLVIFNAVQRAGVAGIHISKLLDQIYSGAKNPPLWAQKSIHVQIYLMNQKLKANAMVIRAKRLGSHYSVYTLNVL